jgi:hypothetical protein
MGSVISPKTQNITYDDGVAAGGLSRRDPTHHHP